MMMVERRAAVQASAKREHRRTGMSAVNVGAIVGYIVEHIVIGSPIYHHPQYTTIIFMMESLAHKIRI